MHHVLGNMVSTRQESRSFAWHMAYRCTTLTPNKGHLEMKAQSSIVMVAAWIAMMFFATECVSAREIHVSKTGNDSGIGDQSSPYLTVGKAAQVAQPGDTVTIHAGTYREWVRPARGGASEDRRIEYRAGPGEKAIIKGSERITTWVPLGEGVWKVDIPNAFFGDYNPYALQLSGGWLNYGQWHHRGDVYFNGKAFYEKESMQEVQKNKNSWHCQAGESTTTIWAHFAAADPNAELSEINVRECLFMPEVTGLSYITIDGLQFMHAAANWVPPVIELQTGAVGTRMGKCWIIENCTVSDIRCVGIILGQAPGADYADIDSFRSARRPQQCHSSLWTGGNRRSTWGSTLCHRPQLDRGH